MHVDNLAFDPGYAILFRLLAQQPGICRGIDMVRIAQRILLQQAKPACFRGHQFRGVATVVFGKTELPGLEPEMLKAGCPAALAGEAKGMNVVMADSPPVFETDAQLDGALHAGQKFCLIDLQQAVHRSEWRYGRLTDANRTDGVRFHQHHVQVCAD